MSAQPEAPPPSPESGSEHHVGWLLAAVSDAMVQLMKQYYGKGPTKAKSYMLDNLLIVVMEGGLTVVEETLVRSGKHHLVREVRQTFENEMTAEFTAQIARLTGRGVLTYQSQILFDPDMQVEIFVLDEPGE